LPARFHKGEDSKPDEYTENGSRIFGAVVHEAMISSGTGCPLYLCRPPAAEDAASIRQPVSSGIL